MTTPPQPEQFPTLPRPEQPVGELALRPREQAPLFSVRSEEVIALVPSVVPGSRAFLDLALNLNPNDKRLHGNEGAEAAPAVDNTADPAAATMGDVPEPTKYNRNQQRKSRSTYGSHVARVIQTGAQYLSTFDDPEEGIRAGREIFQEEFDEYLGDAYKKRIVPSAQPLRELKQVARTVASEVSGVMATEGEEGVAQRYILLKALGQNRYENNTNYDRMQSRTQSLEPEYILTAFHAMTESTSHRELISELQTGAYDHLIATDVLRFLDSAQQVDGDLAKIQQLVKCLYLFTGQPTDRSTFYRRMVSQLDTWPVAQRQVITEARQLLQQRLETRLGQITRALVADSLIIKNPKESFERSLDQLASEMLRQTPVTPQNRAQLMRLRSAMKRERRTSRRDQRRAARKTGASGEAVDAQAEIQREPATIVACNLNDYSISESTEGMVDEFIKAASQGNVTLLEDVKRMLSFMARRDLPPSHRRGVKSIGGALVRFGTPEAPDKLWNFYEFKPTDAAGLSLRTNVAKNSRIYFIKLDENTLGVIGIKPRSEQDAFLRHIRIKIKRRDGEE